MKTYLALLAGTALIGASASAQTLNISALDNIWGAGHAYAPGDGSLPASYSFAASGGLTLTFSSVAGTVSSAANTCGPDGAHGGPNTDMGPVNGISGIKNGSSGFFLVGVFLGPTEPSGSAPTTLDFSSTGLTESFLTLSPVLNQTFFVGDGLTGTGSGTVQKFFVPNGATRLFLGFADGNPVGSNSDLYNYHGSPSYYWDNSGSLTASFTIVPEPATASLAAVGLALLALRRKVSA